MRGLALVFAMLVLCGLTVAVEPSEMLDDPVLEARARALGLELRCPVCQSEPIDASNAELARDLRRLVRERLLAGDTDEQVLDYIHARYGDYVLLRPRVKPLTWVLWFGPFAVLALGAGAIAFHVRGRARLSGQGDAALTASEEARLREIVKD
jgi:cytochrome c-type biogenesis protein CcmH